MTTAGPGQPASGRPSVSGPGSTEGGAEAEPEAAEPGPELNPFARHRGFAASIRSGTFTAASVKFADALKPPIDVRADKILDLARFGQPPKAFVKMPRPKRADELPEGHEDRLKDHERQFTLRNLMRYVMTIDEKDPIEWQKQTPRDLNLRVDVRAHLHELHRKPELVEELGSDHCRAELAWRHEMHDVMQWEQYFSREIREDFPGPIWKHDPVTNPVPAKKADAAHDEESE